MISFRGSEEQEYIMSMDALMDNIDLEMLPPFHHQRRDDTVPLWSKRSSGPGAEYFEFEVLADDGGEDADCGTEPVPVQRCHVCDVDVPVAYWGEHGRSVGHRACCSIADVALQRARKQMLQETPLGSAARSSTYFCPLCSRAVDLTNQKDHEETPEHSQSVLHTKLLQTLAILYQNKNNLNKVCKDLLQIVNEDARGKKVDIEIESEDIEHNNDKIINKDVTITVLFDDKIDKEIPSKDSPIPTNTKDESAKHDVIIITESKAKLKVSFDNYHGFSAIRGVTQCLVCRELVEDETQHILNEKHKMKVEAVAEDKHCIRQLDHLYNYCILCNEIIGAPEAHILSNSHHEDLLKKALIEDPETELLNLLTENLIITDITNEFHYYCDACKKYVKKTTLFDHVKNYIHKNSLNYIEMCKKKSKPNMEYCYMCDTYVRSTKKSRKVHLAGKDHKYKLWLSEKDTSIHYHMQKSGYGNVVVCRVCDIQLNNNIDEIKQHVNCDKHQSMSVKRILKHNYMENINDSSVFCFACDETEYVIHEIQHTKSKPHLSRLYDLTVLKIGLDELKQIKKSHENAKFKEILRINRIEHYNALHYQCKVCCECFKKADVFNHLFSKNHKRCRVVRSVTAKEETPRIVEAIQENISDKVNETETVDLKQSVDKTDTSIEDVEKINESTSVTNTQAVPIKETTNRNYVAHSETVNSTNNNSECEEEVTCKLEANWLEKRVMKNDCVYYHCIACEAAIDDGLEEAHIVLDKHQSNILKSNRLLTHGVLKNDLIYYCTLCSKTIELGFEETHLLSENHKLLYDKNEELKIKEGLSIISENYFCEICSETIELQLKNEHIKSESHKANIQKSTFNTDIMNVTENLITNNNKEEEYVGSITFEQLTPAKKLHYLFEVNPAAGYQVTCLVCNINMSFGEEKTHRKDKKHRETYANMMESNTMFRIKHRCFCECCREILKVNCEYIHLTSERHRLNLIRNTERMDKKSLYDLSLKMFHEDIAAEKMAKRDEKYAKLTRTNFEDDGDYRFENLKTCMFLNSSDDIRSGNDKEDNSVSDSNDSFESARTSVASEEIPGLIPVRKYVAEDSEKGDDEVETAAKFTKSISYLFEETNNPLEFLCKLCHCVVSNRSNMIVEHIVGVKHTKKYENILLVNELKETIDNQKEATLKYRCHACGIDVEKMELFAHINGNKHKLYLTAKPSTSGSFKQTGEENDAIAEPVGIGQITNEKNKIDVVLTSKHLHKLILTNGNNELYCELCDTDFSDTDLNTHINSRTHQMTFEVYLLENKIKKVGVTFFCDLCKIGLAEGTELDHLYGDTHKDNMTKYSLSTSKIVNKNDKSIALKSEKVSNHVCTVCNVEILNIPKIIQTHYVSVGHKTNVAKTPQSKKNSINSALENVQTVSNEYFCKVCNVKVPNNPSNIRIHNNGVRHKSNFHMISKPTVAISLPKLAKSKPTTPLIKLTESKPTIGSPLLKLTESKPIVATPLPKLTEFKPTVATPLVKLTESKPTIGSPLLKLTESKPIVATPLPKLTGFKPTVATPLPKLTESKPTVATPLVKLTESKPTVASPSPKTNSLAKPKSSSTKPATNIAKPAILNYIENGFCHVCKTNVENNITCIREHLKGKTHNETLKTLLNENNAQILRQFQSNSSQNVVNKLDINDSYVKEGFCHACKMKVPNNIGNIKEHIKGKYHTDKINIIKSNTSANKKMQPKSNQNLVLAAGPVQNNTNDDVMPSEGAVTRKRTRTRRKKKDFNSIAQSNVGKITGPTLNISKIIMTGTSSNTPKDKCFFECTVCKTYILNTFEYISNHHQEPNHIEKFNKLSKEKQILFYTQVAGFVLGNQDKAESTDQHTSIPQRNDNTSINNNNDHNQPKVDLKTDYFCKICTLKVPNNQNNIQEHIKGTRHKNNVENLIKMPPPTELEAESVYVCKICDLNVTNNINNIAEHFKGKKHKINIDNLKSFNEIPVNNLPNTIQDNNSDKKEETNLGDVLFGAQSLQVDNADIKSIFKIIRQLYDCSANESGSRIFDSNTVDEPDIEVNINSDSLFNAAVASTSRLTLDNVIEDSHTNSGNPSCDKFNESENTESIDYTNLKIIIDTTQRGTSDDTIGASCTSNDDYKEKSALKCDDTRLGLSHLYDNPTDNLTDSRIADSTKIDGTEINIKTESRNVVDKAVENNTLDNIILNSPTNLLTASCDNSDESENTENISTNIPTIKINTSTPNESSEMQILKSTELTSSNDIASVPRTSNHEDNVEITSKNIILEGTKKEESNTETNNVRVSKTYDVTCGFVTVVTEDDSYEDNGDSDISDAKTEPNLGFYVCSVCDRAVPNNQTDIKSHLISYHHLTKLSEKKEKEQEGLLSNPEEYYCNVCNEKMPNNYITIKHHDDTLGHRNRFERLLLLNKIKIRDDKVCYCEACDLFFSKFTVNTHIDREKHKSLLQESLLQEILNI